MRDRIGLLAVSVALAGWSGPVAAAVVPTGPIDNLAFQALVDAAAPGDTILCAGGLYPFSGPVRITKSLRIVAADSADPPVFEGTGVLTGTPGNLTGNNGFLVIEQATDIRGLEFHGLHFRDFQRALSFIPDTTLVAECTYPEAGTLSGLVVHDIDVSHCARGVQIWSGNVEGWTVRDSRFSGTEAGVWVRGSAVPDECSPGAFRLLRGTADGLVVRNQIDTSLGGIIIVGGARTVVTDNVVEAFFIGIGFGDDTTLWVPDFEHVVSPGRAVDNTVSRALAGFHLGGPTAMRQVLSMGNTVVDCFFGTFLDFGANHFLVTETTNAGNAFDFWLGLDPFWADPPPTHDNTIVAGFDDTVVDFGVDNLIVGPYNLIENPHVPDGVKEKLVALADFWESLHQP